MTVRVRDNGHGIEPALLPQIFELFTQADRTPDRSQGGLGIGLALVRSLVDAARRNRSPPTARAGTRAPRSPCRCR